MGLGFRVEGDIMGSGFRVEGDIMGSGFRAGVRVESVSLKGSFEASL